MNGMSRQADGPRSRADEVSAQEYQDKEFSDELGLSAPPHPLFPASLDSNNAVTHKKKLWTARIGRQEDAVRRVSEHWVLTPGIGLVDELDSSN